MTTSEIQVPASEEDLVGSSEYNTILKSKIPSTLMCSDMNCRNIGLFAQQNSVGYSFFCENHVKHGEVTYHTDIYASHGIDILRVPAKNEPSFIADDSLVRIFADKRKPLLISLVCYAVKQRDLLREARAEFEHFKDNVVETVVDWNGGCLEGKTEFLQSIGLDYPMTEVTLTITFSYRGSGDNIDTSSIEYVVAADIGNDNCENMYVEIDY